MVNFTLNTYIMFATGNYFLQDKVFEKVLELLQYVKEMGCY